MIALKNTGIRIVFLLVLQTPWLETSHSQQPGSSTFDQEASKQEAIYQSQGEKVPEGYVVDRSLLAYASILSSEFDRSLANLGPTNRWLDIGAGEGRAILDYYAARYDSMHLEGRERRGKKAQAVAISIEDRRTPHWHKTAASLEANKIRYLSGRRLREYSLEELGRFQLITDVIGGFSYSRDLSLFMEKVLGFLELSGRFYTLLLDVLPESGANRTHYPDTLFLTEIANADGSDVRVCSWLKSITCVEVACESRTESKRPIEIYRIHKVCNGVTVPALVLLHYKAGTPPQRRFQLRDPSPASPGRTSTTR
jgi:SAM-dependent methyltransferase